MEDEEEIIRLNEHITEKSNIIKFFDVKIKGKKENLVHVVYSNIAHYHLNKIMIEQEYYIYTILKSCPAIPSIKSSLYSQLYHDHAVYGFLTDRMFINLYYENRLRKVKQPFSLQEVKTIFYKLALILENAESKGIYHGPFSLFNIIRTFSMDIKLVGWSQEHFIRDYQLRSNEIPDIQPNYWNNICPSFRNANQLIIDYFDINVYKRDIYCLGKVILKLLTEKTDWEKDLSGKINDESFFYIMRNILSDDLSQRFTFKKLKETMLLNDYDKCDISIESKKEIFKFIKDEEQKKTGLKIEEEYIDT